MIAHWGVSEVVLEKYFKNRAKYDNTRLVLGYMALTNLPSDCGAVIMSSISVATPQNLEDAIQFCKLSGYSLMLGTVTSEEKVPLLTKLGFEVSHLGPSHRNPNKPHYLVKMHIPESTFKVFGYQKTEA